LADEHTKGAVDEESPTAKAFNGPKGNWSGADVDKSGDEADEEGIANGSELLKESGSEIENEAESELISWDLHPSRRLRSLT